MSSWSNGTNKRAIDAFATENAPDEWAPLDESPPQPGAVRIARRVLRTVVEQAALSVPGVARMATLPRRPSLLGVREQQHGVRLDVRGDVVGIDLYVIAAPDVSMLETGTAVQEAVGAAVEHILGMGVSVINVYIQDVA